MTARIAPAVSIILGLLLAAGCGAVAAPSPSPSVAAAASYDDFATGLCSAFQSLQRAVGNPDSGEGSEISDALEAAADRRDAVAAAQAAAQLVAELEVARGHAAFVAGWAPAESVGRSFDRLAVAFQAWAAAAVEEARGTEGADRQQAFEQAGGVEAWTDMLQGVRDVGSQRPPGPPRECEGVPISL